MHIALPVPDPEMIYGRFVIMHKCTRILSEYAHLFHRVEVLPLRTYIQYAFCCAEIPDISLYSVGGNRGCVRADTFVI